MKSIKIGLSLFMTVLMLAVCGSSLVLAASTRGSLGPHTISPYSTMEYWHGTNGMDIASGGHIDFEATMNNSFTTNAGWRNVSTDSSTTVVSGNVGSSVSYYTSVPSTSIYRAWLKNCTSVPMPVTGGHCYSYQS